MPAFTTAQSRSRDSNLGTFSAYIQNQLNIGDHIEVIAGLRFDRFDLDTVDLVSGVDGSRVDQEVSPRVGLIFKPQEELSFYVSYAESFLPQAGDQFLLLSPTDCHFRAGAVPQLRNRREMGGASRPIGDRIHLPPRPRQHARARSGQYRPHPADRRKPCRGFRGKCNRGNHAVLGSQPRLHLSRRRDHRDHVSCRRRHAPATAARTPDQRVEPLQLDRPFRHRPRRDLSGRAVHQLLQSGRRCPITGAWIRPRFSM